MLGQAIAEARARKEKEAQEKVLLPDQTPDFAYQGTHCETKDRDNTV